MRRLVQEIYDLQVESSCIFHKWGLYLYPTQVFPVVLDENFATELRKRRGSRAVIITRKLVWPMYIFNIFLIKGEAETRHLLLRKIKRQIEKAISKYKIVRFLRMFLRVFSGNFVRETLYEKLCIRIFFVIRNKKVSTRVFWEHLK